MEEREDYNDEINLLDYFNVLKKRKSLIIIIVSLSVVAAIIVSFLLPKIYAARAVVMPVDASQERLGGMSSLAMQFGISTPSAPNTTEIVSLLNSNVLLEKVIKTHNLLPVFFSSESLKNTPDIKKSWNALRYMKKIFRVNNNKREGIIELSVEFSDPEKSAEILKHILAELTNYMSSEAKRVAETNRKYLETLIDKNADPLIRQKIYTLIAQQIETSMMAEVKENFAFKILDPPKVPDRKIKPSKRKIVMLAFFVSLFGSIFIAFFMEYWEKVKQREKIKGENRGKN
jgi:uncharacterized protein involved in exopolysaccharide biosynthesis